MTLYSTPYTMVTPFWYVDYFAMNNFNDCTIYLLNHFSNGSTLVVGVDSEILLNDPLLLDRARRFETQGMMGSPRGCRKRVGFDRGRGTQSSGLPAIRRNASV